MTREDIISMYKKANGWCPTEWDETVKDLERFADAGVNAVVLKPFDAVKLCAQVEQMLTEKKSSLGS